MPVNIHGKEYRTVAERLAEMSSDTKGKYSLSTKVIELLDGAVLMKATLDLDRGTFVGHAYEREDAGYINKTSHVENCETSAIGRALASAGYAGSEFASADEVANAIKQQDEKKPELSNKQILKLLETAGEINEETHTMIGEKIDSRAINAFNYNVSMKKLENMKNE